MTYEKLDPIEAGDKGCLNCGVMHQIFPMDALIAIEFGMAIVTCDRDIIYDELNVKEDKFWTGQDVENMAMKRPESDWRIMINGPLYSSHYQRQGDKHWVLYYKDLGFA